MSRVTLLTPDENKERVSRGVTVEMWFAAPRTPANREQCPPVGQMCPHLRCRMHNGPGASRECALDVADEGEHELVAIGDIMRLTKQRIEQLEKQALRNARREAARRKLAG